MLVRIVKLRFKKENIKKFEVIFDTNKQLIRQVTGCNFLELYQDKDDSALFFTYSYWDSQADLDNYRNSDFFKKVWSETKPLFSEKPAAWSLIKKETLK
ncbi:antibiotic biosynthesis monooxygenase [Arenibacter sp. 6A1]|uniref:putative quinol monooxygenase n=1 Tax=Arenibacter sp. 6A1 TaxID=2720391 RepID=UPI001447155B|nr:antibiotic biosynthesis monooxygenase family protein [Arenibacter sp. 6A1]NKI27843.1 antibiotic biosynthesis monooxygenase [Arenibacter sp. 6A1]